MTSPLAVIHDRRFQNHQTPAGHPECSSRLQVVAELFAEGGVFASLPNLTFEACELADLKAIHGDSYLQRIAATAGMKHMALDPDTHTSALSFETALLACGAAKRSVDAVMRGEHAFVFALVRPPGHHAERNRIMGFCLFNNIALAASYARTQYGLERVLILDWDVHHGNGTQDIFYDDPHVLFCSTHQFPFYPGTGNFHEAGRGEGLGFTVNVPMPAGLADADFQEIFERIVAPLAKQYQPQLILVSAGYDAYHLDPLGGQKLTEAGFARLTRIVMDLSKEGSAGKIVFLLEGGYDLQGLKNCVSSTLQTLQTQEVGQRITGTCSPRTQEVINEVRRIHGSQWKF